MNKILGGEQDILLSTALDNVIDEKIGKAIFTNAAPRNVCYSGLIEKLGMQCAIRRKASSIYLSLRDILGRSGMDGTQYEFCPCDDNVIDDVISEDVIRHIEADAEGRAMMVDLDDIIDDAIDSISSFKKCENLLKQTIAEVLMNRQSKLASMHLLSDKKNVALKPLNSRLCRVKEEILKDFSGNVSGSYLLFKKRCADIVSDYDKVMCSNGFPSLLDYVDYVNHNHEKDLEDFREQLESILSKNREKFCKLGLLCGSDETYVKNIAASVEAQGRGVIDLYILKYSFFPVHEKLCKLDLERFDSKIEKIFDKVAKKVFSEKGLSSMKGDSVCVRLCGVLYFGNHPDFKKNLFEFSPIDRSACYERKREALNKSMDFYKNYFEM